MFCSQDSVDFGGPATESFDYPRESASPVRKKGRSRHFVGTNVRSRETDNFNPFAFSQDSMAASQFSQTFAERMGAMNMFCSQENSNISGPDSAFGVPGMGPSNNIAETSENTLQNAKFSGLSVAAGASSSSGKFGHNTNTATAMETERAIDVSPPMQNAFLAGVRPHCETYLDPTGESVGAKPGSKAKAKRPIKVWIGAFTERPRILTEFEEVRMLGEGTFSTVMCVRHRLDGTLYAVKRVREGIVTERQGQQLLREVAALAALQGCPQIVRYYGAWIDNNHLFIQTELCHLGSLEDLVAPRPSPSSILHIAAVALQALQTGSHLTGTANKGSAQERNRSDSFNSIDLTQTDQLLADECLTAPGPSSSSATHSTNTAKKTAFPAPVLLSAPTAGSMDLDRDSNSGLFRTQSNQRDLAASQPSTHAVRGIGEDVAWLLLFEVSLALKYMHEREMAHLDLRPANIFLTTAASYREMHARDPQRLPLLVAQGYDADGSHLRRGNKGAGPSSGAGREERPLFASILSAAPLQQHQASSGTAGLLCAVGMAEESYGDNEFSDFDVRAEVEAMLLRRQYVVRVGDLGHCCRLDEKSAIQEGQTRYCARELINMEEESLDCTKSDVFSLGASVYELCLGRFLGADGEEGIAEWHRIRDGHLDPALSQQYSPALVEVLQLAMHPDPAHRPSAAALATHLLSDRYPHSADRKAAVFPPSSLEDLVAQLRRENAELKARLSGGSS